MSQTFKSDGEKVSTIAKQKALIATLVEGSALHAEAVLHLGEFEKAVVESHVNNITSNPPTQTTPVVPGATVAPKVPVEPVVPITFPTEEAKEDAVEAQLVVVRETPAGPEKVAARAELAKIKAAEVVVA